jgi:tetratricopeptide (TPR) repeat protein
VERSVSNLNSKFLAEPVLVGRERELEALQMHFDSAVQGKGTTVFVSGEAGSGKTRLINEFLEIARKKDVAVLTGCCLSDAAVPYFPFVEAFDAYFTSTCEEKQNISPKLSRNKTRLEEPEQIRNEELGISGWLRGPKQAERIGKLETLTPQVWKDQAFTAVTKTLHLISAHKPIILFIEDIHWADSASLTLLHYISRGINSERILVLATFRSEELTVDSEGHPRPLVEVLRLMSREDLFKEIKLSNLDKLNVGRMVESMVGGCVYSELVEKLAKESQGSPLFVVESIIMFSEYGSLVQEGNQWRLTVDKVGIPTKIRDIILRRLYKLSTDQRRVLDVASVIGEEFDPDLLGAVLNYAGLQVLETLNTITQSTSLIFCEENSYRFDHAKCREVLYEEIPPLLKRGYHARIAEMLEASGRDIKELPVSDLAHHYAQAGNRKQATKYALAAGQDSLSRFSNAEAIKHFAYVLQSLSAVPEYSDEREVALEGLGDAYYANCMFEEATKTFEDLASSEVNSVKLRAFRKAFDAVFSKLDEPAHSMELARKAEEYAASDRLESARVRANRGRAFRFLGDFKASLEDYDEALRVFEEEYSLPDVAIVLLRIGSLCTFFEGFHEKGLSAILRSMAVFEELNDVRGEIDATFEGGDAFLSLGLYQESWSKYNNFLKVGQKIGDFNRMAQAIVSLSVLLEVAGNLSEAVSKGLQAVEYSKKTDANWIQGWIYANLARQYAILEDLKHAGEYFGKLMELPPEILSNVNNVFWVSLAEAVFFAAQGKWKEANQRFEENSEWIQSSGIRQFIVLWRKNYAWALDKQGRTREARIQLEELQKMSGEVEERFAHAAVQANLMAPREVEVGEEFEMRLDLVNIAKKAGLLEKAERAIPSEFKVTALPPLYSLQNGNIEMKRREIGAFQVETVKLTLRAVETGVFSFKPQVVYEDDLGETKTCKLNPVNITVQPA